jgi:hypothetical protein
MDDVSISGKLLFFGEWTMTPYQKRLTQDTQRLAEDMKIRNLAQATIDAYTYHVQHFAATMCGAAKHSTGSRPCLKVIPLPTTGEMMNRQSVPTAAKRCCE